MFETSRWRCAGWGSIVFLPEYGGPEAVAPKANASMVSDVITVEFLCPNDPVQTKTITRKLLKDMDVQKVTGLAQRIFRTGGKIPTLSFVRRDVSYRSFILRYLLRKPNLDMPIESNENLLSALERWNPAGQTSPTAKLLLYPKRRSSARTLVISTRLFVDLIRIFYDGSEFLDKYFVNKRFISCNWPSLR